MINTIQLSVNIAIASSMILVLAVILITCICQRRLFTTTIPLCFMAGSIILLLIVQLVAWAFTIIGIPGQYGSLKMNILYIFDYLISYGVSVSFYHYLEALIKDGYKRNGSVYIANKKVHTMMLVWGVASTFVYAFFLLATPGYNIENGINIHTILAYACVQIMVKFACVCALVLVVRHRKVIGKHEAALSIGFIVLISVFVIFDELCGICISYVLEALYTFILYVSIDLHKGLLLERQEKEVVELKTQIMLSQMQPHFLYNVLTTISALCDIENAKEARDVVNHFADYFRANLDSLGNDKTIPFDKELEHIKTYLWLEKVRFESSLNISYEIGPTDFVVPSLTIQPIVENAVKHGILKKPEPGTLTLRTYESERDYVIEVEDDGVGFDINEKPDDGRSHVGIENVSKRLELVCNGYCDIHSEKGKGTVVSIHIPKGE